MSNTDDQAFKTGLTSKYLFDGGIKRSPSWLEKVRARGTEDPRTDRGPDFYRDERGICWYLRRDLDRYIAEKKAALQFRAPAEQPMNLRRNRDDHAA